MALAEALITGNITEIVSSFTKYMFATPEKMGQSFVDGFMKKAMPMGPTIFSDKNWTAEMKKQAANIRDIFDRDIWQEVERKKREAEAARRDTSGTKKDEEAVGDRVAGKVARTIEDASLAVTHPGYISTDRVEADTVAGDTIAGDWAGSKAAGDGVGEPSLMDMVPERDRFRVAREDRASKYEDHKAELRRQRAERRREYLISRGRGPYKGRPGPPEEAYALPEIDVPGMDAALEAVGKAPGLSGKARDIADRVVDKIFTDVEKAFATRPGMKPAERDRRLEAAFPSKPSDEHVADRVVDKILSGVEESFAKPAAGTTSRMAPDFGRARTPEQQMENIIKHTSPTFQDKFDKAGLASEAKQDKANRFMEQMDGSLRLMATEHRRRYQIPQGGRSDDYVRGP
jgi:hypothetical protein